MNYYKEFEKIKFSSVLGPLFKPMLYNTATEKEVEIFNKCKKFVEIGSKFAFFYPCYMAICHDVKKKREPWTYKKIDHIQRKDGNKKRCIYYIPSDVYPYIRYDGYEVKVEDNVPENLKMKAENCARFFELELNYLRWIIGVNFEKNNIFTFEDKWKRFKPCIVINNTTDKLSFGYEYENIIDNDYFNKYDELLEEEKRMIESGNYII